jgi:hypothetical protein
MAALKGCTTTTAGLKGCTTTTAGLNEGLHDDHGSPEGLHDDRAEPDARRAGLQACGTAGEERPMRRLLERSNRFLDAPLALGPRALLVLAAGVLALTFTQPLWNMTMFAPQYGNGLRLDIHTDGLRGGNRGQDLKEINLLNHYIGMRDLSNDDFTEFEWMPFAIGALALLFLRAAVHGRVSALVDSLVLFTYFGAFSLWSFGSKLYAYGHNLAPTAPVKVDPFMPPMFGYKQLANFEVYSYPAPGTYLMTAAGLLVVLALVSSWWSSRRSRAAGVGQVEARA